LFDATAITNGSVNDNDSDDTSMMGTKYDKKDIITTTAAYLAQGMFFVLEFAFTESHCILILKK
jgi:hypothetical protein